MLPVLCQCDVQTYWVHSEAANPHMAEAVTNIAKHKYISFEMNLLSEPSSRLQLIASALEISKNVCFFNHIMNVLSLQICLRWENKRTLLLGLHVGHFPMNPWSCPETMQWTPLLGNLSPLVFLPPTIRRAGDLLRPQWPGTICLSHLTHTCTHTRTYCYCTWSPIQCPVSRAEAFTPDPSTRVLPLQQHPDGDL